MKVFTPPYRKITSNKELEVMSTPKVGHLPSEKNQMSKSDVFLKPSCFCSGTQEKPAPIFYEEVDPSFEAASSTLLDLFFGVFNFQLMWCLPNAMKPPLGDGARNPILILVHFLNTTLVNVVVFERKIFTGINFSMKIMGNNLHIVP